MSDLIPHGQAAPVVTRSARRTTIWHPLVWFLAVFFVAGFAVSFLVAYFS